MLSHGIIFILNIFTIKHTTADALVSASSSDCYVVDGEEELKIGTLRIFSNLVAFHVL